MIYSVSNLDRDHLKAIEELEQETGRTLLAFSPLVVESDKVDEGALQKIQRLGRLVPAMRRMRETAALICHPANRCTITGP